MPDISAQLLMAQQAQQRGVQGWQNVGDTLNQMLERKATSGEEQAVVKFFTQNDVTPQSIQQFKAMFPTVPLQNIYQVAGAIATQKKSQRMKDYLVTLKSRVQTDPDFSFDLKTASQIVTNPEDMPDFIQTFVDFKKLNPEIKWENVPTGGKSYQTIGGKKTGVVLEGAEKANVKVYDPKTGRSITVARPQADNLIKAGWLEGEPGELKTGVEEKYDQKTHVTWGRDYKLNPDGTKTYTSEWRSIKGRESTRISIDGKEKSVWVTNRAKGIKKQVSREVADALILTGDWEEGTLSGPQAKPKRSLFPAVTIPAPVVPRGKKESFRDFL